MQRERVVQRLDRVAHRLGVEEVEQDRGATARRTRHSPGLSGAHRPIAFALPAGHPESGGSRDELFAGSPIEEAYLQIAPNPGDFPKLVEKLKQLDTTDFAWPEQDIRAIAAPTLIVLGDSDGIRLEHAVELFGLRGGGVMGDLAGLPSSQLAVLPGTTHFVPPGFGLLDRAEWLLAMIPPFLDAPMPEA